MSMVKFCREPIILGALFNQYDLIGRNGKKGINALTVLLVQVTFMGVIQQGRIEF